MREIDTFASSREDAGGGDNPVSRVVGKNTKMLRLKAGMTQERLSSRTTRVVREVPDLSGCPSLSRVTIMAIESGSRPVRIDEAVVLASALKTSLAELMASAPGESLVVGKETGSYFSLVRMIAASEEATIAHIARLDSEIAVLRKHAADSDSRWRAMFSALGDTGRA